MHFLSFSQLFEKLLLSLLRFLQKFASSLSYIFHRIRFKNRNVKSFAKRDLFFDRKFHFRLKISVSTEILFFSKFIFRLKISFSTQNLSFDRNFILLKIYFLPQNLIFDSKFILRLKISFLPQNFILNTKCNFRSEISFSTRKDSEIWLRDFSIGKILKFNFKTPVQVSNSGSKSKVRLNNARYVWGG